MVASIFDLFKVGIGPSSSHTMGPMTAALAFTDRLSALGHLGSTARVECKLFGSLALTGKGHASDRAVLLGLSGQNPATCDPDEADIIVDNIRNHKRMQLGGSHVQGGPYDIEFVEDRDLLFLQRERLEYHSNAMRFSAFDAQNGLLEERSYYSVGGGAVLDQDETNRNAPEEGIWDVPFQFCSGDELVEICADNKLEIAELMRRNELAAIDADQLSAQIDTIRQAMSDCIDRGIKASGILPGGLKVKRRAPDIYAKLLSKQERALADPLTVLDWVNLWALAVNEENAAGGRVVTAPTNGAAGIVPAVLRYYERFTPKPDDAGSETFLLTAAAIGSLFKENASISGAEVGCQGEVGVACSMAAAGLAAAMGGTPEQIENAAEIGMEHNLGLTCDPVAGLVQVPCIERNAVGSIKAIEAARLALLGDGTHRVSLDEVIETMRKTGLDMGVKYKETAQGGLAVNVVEC